MARPTALRAVLPGLRRLLTGFRGHLGAERGLLAGSSVALFAGVALRLLEPWPLKFVFDDVLGDPGRESSLPWIDSLTPLQLLGACAVATVAVIGLQALASYASTVGFALAGNRILTRAREEVYRHVQTLSLSFDSRTRVGDLVTRMVSDIGILKEVVVTAFLPLAANLAVLVGMVVVMLLVDWRLALAALSPLPIFAAFTARQSRRIQEVGHKQRSRESDLASSAAEMVGNLQVVQALSLEDDFSSAFAAASHRELKQGVRGKRLAAGLERSVDLLVGISTAIVLFVGASRALAHQLTPGDLLVFLTYQRRAFRPIRDFAKYTARLAKASAAGQRVLDLLERTPSVQERPDAVAAPAFRGTIAFRSVGFAYPSGAELFTDLSLKISAGEHLAIVGPSGAGKSTLVRLLLRLLDPQRGEVRIDGHDVREFSLASLRSRIGVVLQDAVLFAGSVETNIGCGAPDPTPARLEEAARLARVDEFVRRLPEGYQTRVGEGGATLSRGQRQRIAIARAAIRDARILVLDEPMTGLDEENEALVREALERVARGRTCLLITHDLRDAAGCDRIVFLEHGRIVECGTHESLTRAGGRYAALFRSQSRRGERDRLEGHIHAASG